MVVETSTVRAGQIYVDIDPNFKIFILEMGTGNDDDYFCSFIDNDGTFHWSSESELRQFYTLFREY